MGGPIFAQHNAGHPVPTTICVEGCMTKPQTTKNPQKASQWETERIFKLSLSGGYAFCKGVGHLLPNAIPKHVPPYIYIYIDRGGGGDPNWWVLFGQKNQFSTNFIVKNGPKIPPTKLWGFFGSLLLCAVILAYKDGHGLQHRFFSEDSITHIFVFCGDWIRREGACVWLLHTVLEATLCESWRCPKPWEWWRSAPCVSQSQGKGRRGVTNIKNIIQKSWTCPRTLEMLKVARCFC